MCRQEADALRSHRTLSWDTFDPAWQRVIRRVVLGDQAADDDELTAALDSLRASANWSFAAPRRRRRRAGFRARLERYYEAAEPGTLVAQLAAAQSTPESDPVDQIPQWLFAFAPAGMAAFRTLAMLGCHPDQPAGRASDDWSTMLGAAVTESVRLWPTTPMILRDTTAETSWRGGTLPVGAAVVVLTGFFHRDDEQVEAADSFRPQRWTDGADPGFPALVPFSGGPGICPGRQVVLHTTSTFLAELLDCRTVHTTRPGLDPARLPRTLDPFGVAVTFEPLTDSPPRRRSTE